MVELNSWWSDTETFRPNFLFFFTFSHGLMVSYYSKQVNNAGILETGSIENTSMEQFDRMFNVNVR